MHARQCAKFFSVLTKCICMHKTKFLMNIFKYCFKDYIKLHEFATLLIMMLNFNHHDENCDPVN